MKFLIEYGYNEDLIQRLRKRYEESILEIFEENKDNVIEILDYLTGIGIDNPEELIVYRIELFTKDINDVKEEIKKHDLMDLVDSINEDITNIDRL